MPPLARLLLPVGLMTVLAVHGSGADPSIPGSQLTPDQNQCALCHSRDDYWKGDQARLYVPLESLAEDVHAGRGVNCHDCHGGDASSANDTTAHQRTNGDAATIPFRSQQDELRESCGTCHRDQALDIVKGVHARVDHETDPSRGVPMHCNACHGEKVHGMLPISDHRSPVFLHNQVQMCGQCHLEDAETFKATVHGKGLYQSGLVVTAVCADCHGAHGIYYAADKRSTLHHERVAETCSECHRYIADRLSNSVHGREAGPGTAAEQPAPGEKIRRKPSCTDCHEGHNLARPELAEFRLHLSNQCGNCHLEMTARYAFSMHGELTELGYQAAANCGDCHGSHDTLPIDDPRSSVAAGENRLKTCQACHLHAPANFASFDPHANFKDRERYAGLHQVYTQFKSPLNICFGLFVMHGMLWYVRALVQRLRHGGHRTVVPEQYALVRFEPVRRALHVTLIFSFLGLTVTGLPLKYGKQTWAKTLAHNWGGFENTGFWHHFFAVVAIVACACYLVSAVARMIELRRRRSWLAIFFGMDSPLPNTRDLDDFKGMLGWFLGRRPKPGFERWTYWEKLDFWAVCSAVAMLGGTGLAMWYPNAVCRFLPGTALNAVKVVHSEFAIYIACFLFLVHLFHTHFRPEKFPVDLSAITGVVSEEHLRRYRPDYVKRLEAEGTLDRIRQTAPSARHLWLHSVMGLFVLMLGLCLVVVITLVSLGE